MGIRRTALALALIAAALALIAAALALPAAAGAAPRPEGAEGGPVRARYDLDLRLGHDGVLTGTADVSWVNAGPGRAARAWLRLRANGPGGCRARRIRVRLLAGGRAGAPSVGGTALPVTLDAPLAAGARGACGWRSGSSSRAWTGASGDRPEASSSGTPCPSSRSAAPTARTSIRTSGSATRS